MPITLTGFYWLRSLRAPRVRTENWLRVVYASGPSINFLFYSIILYNYLR